MSEMVEIFRAMDEQNKLDKRQRKAAALLYLEANKIPFEAFNNDEHIRFGEHYDYWPSTGLFMHRKTKARKYSLAALVDALRQENYPGVPAA